MVVLRLGGRGIDMDLYGFSHWWEWGKIGNK